MHKIKFSSTIVKSQQNLEQMTIKPIELTADDAEQLRTMVKRGTNWRERRRAEVILLLSQGHGVDSVAKQVEQSPELIRRRRRFWASTGMASIVDKPRSGAPSKLNNQHRAKLFEWVNAEPLSSRVLLSRLESEYGVSICIDTLFNELKRLGFVCKRTRHSLKKSVIPSASSKPN